MGQIMSQAWRSKLNSKGLNPSGHVRYLTAKIALGSSSPNQKQEEFSKDWCFMLNK